MHDDIFRRERQSYIIIGQRNHLVGEVQASKIEVSRPLELYFTE